MNQENTETKCPGFGLPTDEPNPNGSLHARTNWCKTQTGKYADALQDRVASNPTPPESNDYISDVWPVSKYDIYAARDAIAIGLVHTKESLEQHDSVCGRSTAKNKMWAERLEKDITQMEDALQALKAYPKSE